MWQVRDLLKLRRRVFLQTGALSTCGLALGSLLARRANAAATNRNVHATAKACILIYVTGGPAQQETFDMKPDAPEAVRGEFKPIATSVPGTFVCEHMPLLAQCAHRYTILRAMRHDNTFHGAGAHYSLTGFPVVPRDPTPEYYIDRRDAPSIGAVVQQLKEHERGAGGLPAAVQLPWWVGHGLIEKFAGQHAGFLGPRYDPLRVLYEDKKDLPGQLPAYFRLPEGVGADRIAGRDALLQAISQPVASNRTTSGEQQLDRHRQQASEIVHSAGAWRAFSIEDEKPATIERYGDSKFGRSCLVARRLIEAGVTLVTVAWPGHENHWDTHSDHFRMMKEELLPPMDRGFSALLEDLANRGLLDETLVAWTGEFGRTPNINANRGRDHWPFVYSAVLAGGGIRPGEVFGASDTMAGNPKDDAVHPTDFVATIYHALGYDSRTEVIDQVGRPQYVVKGQPVLKLF
jgi:hypothetical protein